MTKELENKFREICKSIPTWALCDNIGLDTETAYVLDLRTEENYDAATEYLKEKCFEDFEEIDRKYIGTKVVMEMDTNGGGYGWWYQIHGDVDEYFEHARKTLEDYLKGMEK